MKKYVYNSDNFTYKEVHHSFRVFFHKLLNVIVTFIFVTVCVYAVFAFFFDNANEKELRERNKQMSAALSKIVKENKLILPVMQRIQHYDTVLYCKMFETALSRQTTHADIQNSFEALVGQNINHLVSSVLKRIEKEEQKIPHITLTQNTLFSLAKNNISKIPMRQPLDGHHLSTLVGTFGNRLDPFYKVMKMHKGVDYTIPVGEPVYATADGKVEEIKSNFRLHGLTVRLAHGKSYKTFYGHLDEVLVKVGAKVKQGDIIARSGNSGKSLGAHLHYEVWKDGEPVNPVHYMFSSISPMKYSMLLESASNIGQTLD